MNRLALHPEMRGAKALFVRCLQKQAAGCLALGAEAQVLQDRELQFRRARVQHGKTLRGRPLAPGTRTRNLPDETLHPTARYPIGQDIFLTALFFRFR